MLKRFPVFLTDHKRFAVKRWALIFCCSISPLCLAQAGGNAAELWRASAYTAAQQLPEFSENLAVYPRGLMEVPEATRYLLWVELDHGRLQVLEREPGKGFSLHRAIPISIGKNGFGKEVEGDKRTPVGVYRVTSYIPDNELANFYGLGAYPINYPNAWDKLNERTGSGIWLHGLPKGVESRPLLDSDGCVVVDNASLTYLDSLISPGNTLMVLGNELRWQDEQAHSLAANELLGAFSGWRDDWESLEADRYLSNYHPQFSDFKRDLDAWSSYKAGINARKKYIDVHVSDLTVMAYPGEEGLVSMRFYQDYKSSNYNWAGWKQLLWRQDETGRWLIVFEGNG